MKKILTKLVAILAVLTMLFSMTAVADTAASEPVTAWLLYFADPGWWPQHQRMDQPSSETGVEATNAQITGPGNYTVGLKFNWQTAEKAMQFNLVLDNAEKIMPGLYVDVTEVRVNGTPITLGDNVYGTFHDDPESGFAPLYNTYWDPTHPDGAGSTGPDPATIRAFDGTIDTETHQVINPAEIVAGSTIEVDFTVANVAGQLPEDIGAKPSVYNALTSIPSVDIPDNATTAHLYYQAGGWWPTAIPSQQGNFNEVTLTGEGHYTASAWFVDQGGWTPSGNGAMKLMLVVDSPAGSTVDGMYIGVSDIRVNGNSINFGNLAYGPTGYDPGDGTFGADDSYAILYDQWMIENEPGKTPWGHETWDGSTGTTAVINPDDLKNVGKIDVDFFVTATQNDQPAKKDNYTWFGKNTCGVAGVSLSDLGLENDWHNIVPVDLTKTAWYTYTLVGADAHIVGTAYVAVNNGNVSVSFEYAKGLLWEDSQCIKWFTDLNQITAAELTSIEGGLTDADVVNVATDLGGATMAYLSINNKITWRQPLKNNGQCLPRYWRNMQNWVDYRADLIDMINGTTP